ncbi:MAG: hypothetical protein ACYC7E_09025 [Armatimonadota bacterium]
MRTTLALLGLVLLNALLGGGASASVTTVWQAEVEKIAAADALRNGATIFDDPQASGGKAIRLPFQAGSSDWSLRLGGPAVTLRGRCLFVLRVRGYKMLPISDGLQVRLIARDAKTRQAVQQAWSIYGINLKPEGFTAVALPLDLPLTPASYTTEMVFTWQVRTEGITPICVVDSLELRAPVLDAPVITEVWPGKVRYAPGETAGVRVTVANPIAAAFTGTLSGEERWGLTGRRPAFTQPVTLKAGEEKQLTAEWKLGNEEYGREIAVSLQVAGKTVAWGTELFSVCKTPLWLSTANGYDTAQEFRDRHTIFYVAPASLQESWRSINFFKKLSPGSERQEFFSWAPGDIADLSPPTTIFPGGEGRMAYRSKETIKGQIDQMRSVGMWPESYVNGTAWSDAGYRLFAEHPDWFIYDANGEVAHYEMERRDIYRHKDDAEFDPGKYPTIHFQGTLNHALPEVQEYIAGQFIKCGKEMGFKGVRMDVRYLEVHPRERDYQGKEIAPTYAEADRISAASVKRVKELVHQALPDFTFGYNYASPDEVKDMPLTMKERCAGAGWMLDEVPCTYQEKTSPYHVWSVYLRRMVSWGDQVNKWGGIYNPFDFRRGGAKYPVDNIYSSIIRLIAGGRSPFCPSYHNSRLPFGNLGRFATRYSEFFFSRDRQWIPTLKGEVDVRAAGPLWWKDTVYWNKDSAGKRQLIVNLINPPMAFEVEENPKSELLPPVRNIQLTAAPVGGKPPTAAYLLSAEPMEPISEASLRMTPLTMKKLAGNKVSVTVPSVIFWKMVVFQY